MIMFLLMTTISIALSDDTECDDLSQFTCLTGECIPIEGLCDGTPNCIDAGDEHPLFCGA